MTQILNKYVWVYLLYRKEALMRLFYFIYNWSRKFKGGVFLLRVLYGFECPCKAKIGENVTFEHRGLGTVVSSNAIIEDNVTIQHHVTLGIKNADDRIIIHENCFIGAHAFILGNVEIGANSKIGAGAMILHDVPAGSTVVNPVELKIINKTRS